ncbi:MAG: hypothetical protein ACM3U2_12850 [Deltaproteobacteria bacterium]
MAKPALDRWIDRYAARIRQGEFLQRAAEAGAAFLFAFGATVLIVKLLIPQAWPNVLWGGLGLIPAFGLAWWLAGRNPRNRWESVARLDTALSAGGLLMMLSELPDDDWERALPQLEEAWRQAIPRVRPKRFTSFLALPLLFAVGACFVPLREGTTSVVLRNTVGQQAAQELESLLNSIDKEQVLDEEEKKQLQEEIRKIADETRETPLTHEKWETVDALRERMKVRLESTSMIALKASDAAAMLAAADSADGDLDLERIDILEKDLGDALTKLGKKGVFKGAPQELQEQLQRLMKNGRFQMPEDAAEREELLDELRDFLDDENRKLADLRKKCSGCKGGQCDGEENDEEGNCSGNANCNRPGRGGVTRGRGDAELTWGDESDKQGTKFKEVVLPRGMLDQPKDEIVAIQKSAPIEEPGGDAPRAGGRADEAAAGQATWNRKLNPRHRNAVRKYFDTVKEK